MKTILHIAPLLSICLALALVTQAQETPTEPEVEPPSPGVVEQEATVPDTAAETDVVAEPEVATEADFAAEPSAAETEAQQQSSEVVDQARDTIQDIANEVDQSPQAQEVSAGILEPIYAFAEHLAFPAFHWVAFALMVTGVISFALQLVLAKLVVLSRMGFSLTEILSDAMGLAVSLIGLVLTTQAAAENSNFTNSPAAVVSSTAVGVLCGVIFYWWGQKQEVQAVKGRSNQKTKRQAPKASA